MEPTSPTSHDANVTDSTFKSLNFSGSKDANFPSVDVPTEASPQVIGSVETNPPNPSHLAKLLERVANLFGKSPVGGEENNAINKEKDNNATPLHQVGSVHQSSTSTSGWFSSTVKTPGEYAEPEQQKHVDTNGSGHRGWMYHHRD